MIIENNPKSLPWLLLFALVCGGLIVFFWRQDPLRLAEAEQKRQDTQQQAYEWQMNQPVLQAQAQAKADRIKAESEKAVAQISNERWLDFQRTQRQAQLEAEMAQLWLDIAYGAAAMVGLIIGVAALGLTFIALALLWRRWLGDPWRDPAYRRRERELARKLELLKRMHESARPQEVAPQKLNGHSHTPESERETHPPI